jgi:hypothetical protein
VTLDEALRAAAAAIIAKVVAKAEWRRQSELAHQAMRELRRHGMSVEEIHDFMRDTVVESGYSLADAGIGSERIKQVVGPRRH